MNKEQKAAVLDAAQELQSNDEPWQEFEFQDVDNCWYPCTENVNPCGRLYTNTYTFRRKPKTITVTIPVPRHVGYGSRDLVHLSFEDADRDQALAAIREAMGN